MTNSIEAVRAFEAHQEQLKTLARRIFDIAQPMEGKSPFGNLVNVGDRLLELAANTDLSQVLKDLEELEKLRDDFQLGTIETGLAIIANSPINMTQTEWGDFSNAVLALCNALKEHSHE